VPSHRRKTSRQRVRIRRAADSQETRAGEAVTIAWTVSVTGVLIADLMAVAAHLFVAAGHREVELVRLLESLMLLSAAAMGVVSLALLPVVWRSRRLKPPLGYVGFAVLVAAAPIAAMTVRLLD
jgi:hypothetical protein